MPTSAMHTSDKPLLVNLDECPRCRSPHTFEVHTAVGDSRPICLPCPNVTRHYRVTAFWIDLMCNVDLDGGGDDIREFVSWTHGGAGLQEKVARWREIRSARIWLIDEYNDSIESILQAYTHGLFFPAMTGACSLAEHVMNRLIIKLRDYFRRSRHYREDPELESPHPCPVGLACV